MNRRHFLRNLALTTGGVYVSTKTIFLPPKGGWPTAQVFSSEFGASIMDLPHFREAQTLLTEQMLDALQAAWASGGNPHYVL